MAEQLQEDWLDARLRDEAVYIDDDGFTGRVVQQLPARQQSRLSRAVILLAVTLVACIVAYLISGRGMFLTHTAEFLVAMPLATVCAIAGACALLVTVVGASAAFAKARL
ncbi:MAG: DUF5056 domain-containing protein [Chthoniobacterales bacterium]|nr:DUF5056 domain-containing protein [Chthoniobacterales bacterium]MDQ3120052.1 DUF5056 domain-containing protein [Verrucomicrobiota bacterium]